MKKVLFLLGLLILGQVVYAEEQTQGIQELVKNDNKANITFMKQPLSQNSQQKVTIERNWFCINIINNGKTIEINKEQK